MRDNELIPCKDWADTIAHYFSHTLSSAEQEAFEAHLETCQAACKVLLSEYQQLDRQIHQALSIEPFPIFTAEQLSTQEMALWRLEEPSDVWSKQASQFGEGKPQEKQEASNSGSDEGPLQAKGARSAFLKTSRERHALLVGVNAYDALPPLDSCVNDALSMQEILEMHEDGASNFSCKVLLGETITTAPLNGQDSLTARNGCEDACVNSALARQRVTVRKLYSELEKLFDVDGTVLFYFSGHGCIDDREVFLATQDAHPQFPGMSLNDVLRMANAARAHEVILIIDSCSSGAFAEPVRKSVESATESVLDVQNLYLRPGVTLLSSAQSDQAALEVSGHGIFTHLIVGALKGGASDIRGQITTASVYAYVDQALGTWEQRPMYKSNARQFSTIRRVTPEISDEELSLLPLYFPRPDSFYRMDPTYEVTCSEANPEHVKIFKRFKRFQVARLLRPTAHADLYFAAMSGDTVELTPLGQFYWLLATKHQLGSIPEATSLINQQLNASPQKREGFARSGYASDDPTTMEYTELDHSLHKQGRSIGCRHTMRCLQPSSIASFCGKERNPMRK